MLFLIRSYDNEDKLSELLNNWKGAPKQMELLLGLFASAKNRRRSNTDRIVKKIRCNRCAIKGLIG